MSFTMEVEARKSAEALVRVLGLVRRRGYEVETVQAVPTVDGSSLRMCLGIESDRPADLLARQLEKLVDVERVRWTLCSTPNQTFTPAESHGERSLGSVPELPRAWSRVDRREMSKAS